MCYRKQSPLNVLGDQYFNVTTKNKTDECCPPSCCDMRGLLSFQILWELSKRPLNGQELAEKIAQRRGTKPTPGTIYPALKDLANRNLIVGTKVGRQIVYQLTRAGKAGLSEAGLYFYQVFGEILTEYQPSSKSL